MPHRDVEHIRRPISHHVAQQGALHTTRLQHLLPSSPESREMKRLQLSSLLAFLLCTTAHPSHAETSCTLKYTPREEQAQTVILSPSPSLPAQSSNPIANNFVSLSIAIHWFQDYTRQGTDASQPNTFTRNLLNSLAESSGGIAPQIRIGGTSADRTTYVTREEQEETIKTVSGSNGIPINVTINPLWFERCFEDATFPPTTKFVFDVPLVRNDSGAVNNTVRGAGWALQAIGKDRFQAFEIGNEEDLYTDQGVVPRNWTVADYVGRWREFSGAIYDSVIKNSEIGKDGEKNWFQGLVFSGLGANKPDWTTATAFNAEINQDGFVRSVSLHNYPAGSAPWVTLGRTFMNHAAIVGNISQVGDDIAFLASSTQTQGIDFVLGETNSDFVNLGMDQFEGVLGSALWGIDYLLYAAFSNVKRVNLHQGTTFGYSAWQPVPVDGVQPKVRPPWYALKFAAEAIGSHNGPIQIATLTSPSQEKMSGYALYDSGKLARLAIINFEEWNRTTPYPRPNTTFSVRGLPIKGATGRRLTAPGGASADTDVTFGGVRWNFSSNGLPEDVEGVPGEIKLDVGQDGVVDVVVGASEAMLVTLDL
ncbi:hypothetical protein V5O48_000385 [Marasmius crinis-equi]|uniref:Beta-glucuronidase C-terminal domain-containing protein n=1 Tax=Marasmius crinis-equi TaxID=585013 RepID=A0ABR3G267_9AGAR